MVDNDAVPLSAVVQTDAPDFETLLQQQGDSSSGSGSAQQSTRPGSSSSSVNRQPHRSNTLVSVPDMEPGYHGSSTSASATGNRQAMAQNDGSHQAVVAFGRDDLVMQAMLDVQRHEATFNSGSSAQAMAEGSSPARQDSTGSLGNMGPSPYENLLQEQYQQLQRQREQQSKYFQPRQSPRNGSQDSSGGWQSAPPPPQTQNAWLGHLGSSNIGSFGGGPGNAVHLSPRPTHHDVSANTSPYLSAHNSPYFTSSPGDGNNGAVDDFALNHEGMNGVRFPHASSSPRQAGQMLPEGLEEAFAMGLPIMGQGQSPGAFGTAASMPLTGGSYGQLQLQQQQQSQQPHLLPQQPFYADVPITASSLALSDEPQSYGGAPNAEGNINIFHPFAPADQPLPSQAGQQRQAPPFGVQSVFARRMASESSDTSMSSYGGVSGSRQDSLTQRWLDLESAAAFDPGSMPPFPMQGNDSRPPTADGMPPPPVGPYSNGFGGVNMRGAYGSPGFFAHSFRQRTGNLTDSPIKSQSPPLLIIPDSSGTPTYQPQPPPQNPPPILKTENPESRPSPSQQTIPASNLLGIPSGGNQGAGSSFLSPIGPGGPSINVVPSTPTSGLKDTRGIWDMMVAQAQQAQAKTAAHQRKRSLQELGHTGPSSLDEASAIAHARLGMGLGPRRASFAGETFGVVSQDQQVEVRQSAQQGVPSTAPLPGAFPMHPVRLEAPPVRQRSMSESAIEPFLMNLSPEELSTLLSSAQALGMQFPSRRDGNVDPRELAAGDTSAVISRSPSPVWDPPQQSRFNAGMVPATAPADGGFVLSGPEAYGANFIVSNDGRRIDFEPPAGLPLATGPDRNFPMGLAGRAQDFLSVTRTSGHHRAASLQEQQLSGFRNASRNSLLEEQSLLDQSGSGAVRRRSFGSQHREQSPYRRLSAGTSHRGSVSGESYEPSEGYSEYEIDYVSDYGEQENAGQDDDNGSGENAKMDHSSDSARRPELVPPPAIPNAPVRPKVTTPATEMASRGRRTTNEKLFKCPVPGCTSTFTRQFNLKGHIRSHNEERPFKCSFPGCEKSFARAHDAKRHSLLHAGKKPFECENCHRTFARFDALSRHHKTDSGAECALRRPLPTNPDGSVSEARYRAHMKAKEHEHGESDGHDGGGGGRTGGEGGEAKAEPVAS